MGTPLKVNINQMRRSAATAEDAAVVVEQLAQQMHGQVDALIAPTKWQGTDASAFKVFYEEFKDDFKKDMDQFKTVTEKLRATVQTYEAMISSIESIIAGK